MAEDVVDTLPGSLADATLPAAAAAEASPRSGSTSAGSAFAGVSTGRIIGRYVVLSKLGAGAMGVVLAAYDPELDRKIALKLLGERSGARDAARIRLQREAQALARLDHRNVVAVHDVGVHDGQLFVGMEYVEGRTLGEWMRAGHGPRPWAEVVRVFVEAGRGLSAAHEAGLIHRDFKPDNVMIGDDGRARVMDFGLARGQGEQADERHEGTIRDPPRGTKVPGWLRKVVVRGLAADPDQRWPSMAALLDALTDDPAVHRGEQSGALLDLRMACLDEHLEHVRATVEVLAAADDTVVSRAVDAVIGLPRLDRCADLDALGAELPPPADPQVATRVAELEAQLTRAAALDNAGKYEDARALAEAVAEQAEGLGYEPLQARAWGCAWATRSARPGTARRPRRPCSGLTRRPWAWA